MRIDDRVREAHLSHYCPGGLGLPVASSRTIGLDRDAASDAGGDAAEDHRLPAGGGRCGRCGHPLVPGQDVRRRLSGEAVHATCRPYAVPARGSGPQEPPVVAGGDRQSIGDQVVPAQARAD